MKLTWYMYHLSTFHFQKNEGENESTFGRLPLQQHFSFRDLMIRLSGPLQLPSILNDNSLLKTFLQKFITSWYTIIISLYHFYVVTFSIWSMCFLFFVFFLPEKQPNKQQKNLFFFNLNHTWVKFRQERGTLSNISFFFYRKRERDWRGFYAYFLQVEKHLQTEKSRTTSQM